MPLDRTYSVTIVRRFKAADLAMPARDDIERGEDVGLAGNQHYQDLRGIGWEEVAAALKREAMLIARFDAAVDLDGEANRYEEECAEAFLPEEDLWGLDVGVAGAVLALSAMDAIPVSSCNAGGFGGHHAASFPHVAFYLKPAAAADVLAVAEIADVGLDIVVGGIGRLFGRTDFDLHRFAQVALARHRASQSASE